MHYISTIYARFISRELGIKENDVERLLSQSSLNVQELFERPTMSFNDFYNFLINVKNNKNDPELGLKVGKKLTPISLGEFGAAILSAPTFLDCMILASKFVQSHSNFMSIELHANFDYLTLEFIELVDLAETRQFQTEVMQLLTQNLIESLLGQPFEQGRFFFPYDKPENHQYYSNYFNGKCEFGVEHAKIEIPKKFTKTRSPFNNPGLWDSYQHKLATEIDQLTNMEEKSFTKQVNDYLNAYPPPLPDIQSTSDSFHLTERTLNRRLHKEGSRFRDLRNVVLLKHARFYLEKTDMTVDAIAHQLGYRDFSSFRRAFKKMMNESPQTYRRKHYGD